MFPSLETLILFITPFFLLMIFIHIKWISLHSNTTKNLPPFVRRFPIIGNLHQLGSAPHRSLRTLAQKHGPLVLIHLGSVPVVVASSAEAAQEIMKTHDLIFSNRPDMGILNRLTYNAKNVGFARYGEYWRQAKSLYVLHLLSAKRVDLFQHVREDEIALMINMIGNNSDSVIDLSKIIVSLTSDIICRIALGRKYDKTFTDLTTRLMEMSGVFSVGSYIPYLSVVDRLIGLEARADKLAKECDVFLEGVIEEHSDRNIRMVGGGGRQDVVDILLEIQREQTTDFLVHRDTIKALILETFVAGTDTTFTTLEWAISELIRHPRAMKRLLQELREIAQQKPRITEKDLENTQHPYLEAVLKESMRLHTPLPLLVPRESTQDVKLMGYDIATGTRVIINAWAISRDPNIWEEPEDFMPERFLNSCIDYKGLDFELLPFGGGRRKCPGINFAMAINKLALANLVYKFDFKVPNEGKVEELDMSESSGLTVHRKYPLLVIPNTRF
ncbi:unnamed protein product [Lactuca saligna]|uniref:Cytochrome P450 n=1 Tax=Lactuca saligna TaxID=75948 RepID=A0AA35Z0Y2_LACSI|nr:unnamed protein product [Lactuca saligna]